MVRSQRDWRSSILCGKEAVSSLEGKNHYTSPIVAFPGVRVAGMLDFLFFMTHLGMSMIGVTR